MEFDEMKSLWTELSGQVEIQKKLTNSLIMKMTQTQFKKKIRNIFIPEAIGTVICFAEAILILMNYQKLDTWYFLAGGIISVVILILLPILSLRSISKMQSINIASNNYKQTLIDYTKSKKQFFKVQRLSYYLGFILLVVLVPVLAKLFDGNDVLSKSKIWIWTVPVGMVILVFFARWVYRYYKKNTLDAEQLLDGLSDSE